MNEQSKVSELKGIGAKTEQLFRKINIETIEDLLMYYPRTYEIYEKEIAIREAKEENICTLSGEVIGKVQTVQARGLTITTAMLRDDTSTIKVVWYRMPFLQKQLRTGTWITVRGKIVKKKGTLQMEHPELFAPKERYESKRNTMQPVYPLVNGISNTLMIKTMKQAVEYLELKKEILPHELRMKYRLAEYNFAMKQIHFPENIDAYILARERLVFEEFLIFILALRYRKGIDEQQKNAYCFLNKNEVEQFISQLPFELTASQKKVWNEIWEDMTSEKTMSRLIQGDVGSGKTIVALLALLLTCYNGYQGVMMAPTEVLAKQHYESITKLLQKNHIPFSIELLTGSMTAKQKREACARISSGEARIVIGTHALIQENVTYKELALVITDEQHRFGVKQRECLADKGMTPHVLVMSATPIPRTLAIILYGDLDISVIDELPANRLPIKNCVVDEGYRETAYSFIQKQINLGHQCYIICPMVEESEAIEAENVLDYTESLKSQLPETITISAMHGRMKQSEKDDIMERFGKNEIQILVSTTVIEVGINVPNATVMMVENAERFGLAQLHQLRGRVGRGEHQSYCIFMSNSKSKGTKERLSILNHSNDGFYIASEDLKLRGPGDLFGIRQSGILGFKLGDVFQDAKLLQKANEAAAELLESDVNLEQPEHQLLKQRLQGYMSHELLEKTL